MDAQAMAAEFPPGYLESYGGHKLVAICVAAIVLDLFFFAARFMSRWIHNTPKGWDDFLMIPALVFSLALAVEGLVGITYCGVGYHVEYIELTAPHKLIRLYKLLIFFPATYAIAVTFPKLSILAMYLRIFTVPFYRMLTYFVIYILVASSTILFMMMLFQCTPVNYFWDKSISGGKCHFDIEKLFLYASLPNIITDVAMLVLPLPFVYRLNMTRKMKIGLALTLLTGSSGLATSILRFVSFTRQSIFPDTPRASVNIALYTILETSMYIVAACLPACRPLFNIIRHPSRNMPNQHDQKEMPDTNERMTIDDIELQRTREETESRSSNCERNQGRYHGLGEGIRGMGGRFLRLGSDAGLLPGRRDSPRSSSSSPIPSLHPLQSSSSDPRLSHPQSHPDPPHTIPKDHISNYQLDEHGDDLATQQLRPRPQSRERSKESRKQPERVHIANMHVGHASRETHQGKREMDGIRVKQEFDVYYDRPAL
ncbi:hypothetical protein EYC80_010580 [Monilinia laxa]|uniref:Rhodopsin domain-containing protein n=1 Tax=Monilinia laxa TaxID=61186 RepID=A0A5N6JNC9_MONLA|nr:hypothetical protein EYC80_010580 [Monilinia laxa]